MGYQFFILLLSILCSSLPAASEPEEGKGTLTVVPAAISGTLEPFSVSVAGVGVFRSSKGLSDLRVNGDQVDSKKDKKKSFFLRRSDNRLELIGRLKGTGEEKLWTLDLPKVEITEWIEGEIKFAVHGDLQSVRIGGKTVPTRKGKGSWKLPEGAKSGDLHVVEIIPKPGKPGRLYNLKLSPPTTFVEYTGTPRDLASLSRPLLLEAFQVGPIGVLQSTSAYTLSAEVAWAPQWRISRLLGLRGHLGVSAIKSAATASSFAILNTELLVSFSLGPFILEPGGGAHSWFSNGGTKPAVSTNLGVRLTKSPYELIQRITLGHALIFSSPTSTHLFRIGLGFRL